jgi:archaellum component FlaC
MADVSVEFGAKDTGLEQTLKTVQDELSRLDEKVKGGELSFNELQSTMRRVAQAEKLQAQLEGMAKATGEAGNAASTAAPKIDNLGNEAAKMGAKVEDSGQSAGNAASIFDQEFAKIAGAFTVGNIAAKGFEAIVSAVFNSARAVVDGFGQALDLGGRLDDLSKRTGETAGRLLVLENAFVEAGVSADQVGTAINKLQNFMVDAANGGARQAAAMDNLGISLADLEGKTPTEQMAVFAGAIQKIEDPTQRAAAASEVFGEKLGGKLLPLLTEFSPALDKSRESVGSLEQIMDENAATFAAAGDTIDRVKGKFAAFAAGVMSETLPALSSLGREMESVDAAALGQEIGQQLNPPLRDMVSIMTGAIDLVKSLGTAERSLAQDNSALGATYRAVNESLMGFNKMMHDVFTNFTPFGYAMQTLKNRGDELKQSQDEAAAAISGTGTAATETKPQLDALPGAGTKLSEEFAKVPEAISSSLPMIGEFKANLDGTAPSISGISENIGAVKNDFSEISQLTAQLPSQTEAHGQSIGGVNEQLAIQSELYNAVPQKIEAINSAEQSRLDKLEAQRIKQEEQNAKTQEALNLDLQIAQAKQAGNDSLALTLENQKLFNAELQKAINAGMGEPEARAFAQQMVSAKQDMAKFNSFVEWLQGEDLGKPVKPLSEKTRDAREEIEAFGKYIGSDFDGVSFPDVAKELGIDTLGMTGSQQIDAILTYIKQELPNAKQSVVDETASKQAVQATAKEAENSLKQAVDYAVNTGEGGKVLTAIEGIAEKIRGLVEKIEGKLPMQALAY